MELHTIGPKSVEDVWPEALPFIASACRFCYDMPEYLLALLKERADMMLVLIRSDGQTVGAMILQIRGDALHLRELGGKLPNGWIKQIDAWLAGLANHVGLRFVTANGRKGWLRRLSPFGWTRTNDTLIRRV